MTSPSELRRLRYAVLGPLEVRDEDRPVRLAGRKERTLLAVLLAAPGGWASAATLTAALWDDPPPSANRSLQAHVTRLRHLLEPNIDGSGPQVLRTVPGGWRLVVVHEELDSRQFEALAARSREALQQGLWMAAATLAEEALAQWRAGEAYPEFTDVPVCASEAQRLAELRAAVEEVTVDAALAVGGAAELVGRLDGMVREAPLRERAWSQLMVALYRSGRPAEALAAYQRARAVMLDELGVEPSDELRAVQAAILVRDPRLAAPAYAALNGVRSGSAAAARNPFRGLLPYTADDADLLLGRERLLARLLARLAEGTAVCAVGPSGSGKSSLVHAGLVPAVRAGALPGSGPWRTTTLTPGDGAADRLPRPGTVDLLVIDQLEELVTSTPPERRAAAVDALLDHVDSGARLVLTVRSDLWAACAALPGLGDILTTSSLFVGALSDDEVRLVVREGARRGGGLAADDDLVDVVVDDVRGRDGALPLLSTALARTWERREAGRLTLGAYRAAGGVGGAVAAAAEETWAALTDTERSAVQRQLLRLAEDGPAGPIRRRVARRELVPDGDAAAARALEALVTARLVVAGDEGVEVSHEALFAAWPRLADWLADDAAGRRVRARLTPEALEWAARDRPSAELLRGARLVEALDWADGHGDALIPPEREYLAASARARDAEIARQRRTSRRLRGLLASVSVALVAAVVAAAVAVQAGRRANLAATTATAHRLSEQALLEPRPDLALLLAAQAVGVHRDPDTEGSLLTTLTQDARLLRVTHLTNRLEFVAASPDGRNLAVSDNQGGVRLVDPDTLAPTRTLVAPTGLLGAGLGFVAGGRRLASARSTPTAARIAVSDTASGRLLASTTVPDAAYLTATDGGASVAVGSYAGTWLWSPGARARRIGANNSASAPSGFTRDGRRVAVTDARQGTVLVDVATGRVVRRLPQARGGLSALTPDGHTLVTAQGGGGLEEWNVDTGAAGTQLAGHGTDITDLALDRTGRLLLSSDGQGTVIVWDVSSGRQLEQFRAGSGPASVTLSPDGRTAYTVDQDGTLAAWDLTGRRGFGLAAPLPPQSNPPEDAAGFSANGRRFVMAVRHQLVVAAGATLHPQRRIPLPAPGIAVAVSPSGRRAIVRTANRLLLVDLVNGTIGRSRRVPPTPSNEPLGRVAWSEDGRTIAVAEGTAHRLLVLAAGNLVPLRDVPLPRLPSTVTAAPHGHRFAVGMLGGQAAVVDARSGAVHTFSVRVDPLDPPPLAFLGPDELAVGGRDGAVRFWDLNTGRPRTAAVPAVAGDVGALDVDRRTGTLVASGGDGGVRLIDIATATPVGTGPGAPVGSATLALVDPARPRLLLLPTGSAPSVWPLNRRNWATHACQLVARSPNPAQWRRLAGDGVSAPVCGG